MTAGDGLLDTSVFIAREDDRPLRIEALPDRSMVCVVTLAELEVGVLSASDTATRSARLATLETAASVTALTVTPEAARSWALLRVALAENGRRANVNDLWIAAVALANGLPVVTQDGDFDVIHAVGGPPVIQV